MTETANIGYQGSGWYWVAAFLLVGYLCMGRSFAYWGIPPLHLFVGEIVLVCFLFWGPVSSGGRWPWIAANSSILRRYKLLFLISLSFGVFQVFYGILLGHPVLSSVRDLAFNYYPIYFFLGVWVALKEPQFLPRILRFAGWANGIYGILYILVLSRLTWFYPGVSQDVLAVPVFGQPLFSGVILLALLSVEKDLRRVWPLLLLNAAVLIGMVTRGEWLAFGVGLLAWAFLTRNFGRVALAGLSVLVLLGGLYVTGFEIEAPEGRGGTISAEALVGRVLAPVNKDLAGDYTSDAQAHEETVAFRTLWWIAIWESVHESISRSLLGHGYGYPLGDLVPYLQGTFIRTPHNVFFYALGYTGWIGVGIFGLFLGEIARLSWRVYRTSGQPLAIVSWLTMLIYALFTAFFETPYGAIPYYLLMGCACTPLLHAEGSMLSPAYWPVNRANSLKPLPGTAS
jgi:O-Antigen ligase